MPPGPLKPRGATITELVAAPHMIMDEQLNYAFWKALIAGILRNALAGVSAWAITKGYLNNDQASLLFIGIAGLVVNLVWNVAHKQKVRSILAAALIMPSGASYEQAKQIAKEN